MFIDDINGRGLGPWKLRKEAVNDEKQEWGRRFFPLPVPGFSETFPF